MKTRLLILILFAQAKILLGQHYLVWEWTGKNSTHGENIFLVNQVVHRQFNQLLPPKLFDENTLFKKTGGVAYRLLKFISIDKQADHLAWVIQHEAFGHGFYFREYGYIKNDINIGLTSPFGGGGSAQRGELKKPRKLGKHEDVSIYYGGAESTGVLGSIVMKQMILNNAIDHSKAYLYLRCVRDLSCYIRDTDYDAPPGNDMANYINKINNLYGFYGPGNYHLKLDFLKRRAWLNLLNPINLYTTYFYYWNYMVNGREAIKMPFIKILNHQYLPNFSMNLNPFGSELVMTNYLRNDKHLFTAEIRLGDNKLAKSNGGGIGYSQIWSGKPFQFDANLDIWNQDVLELGGDTIHTTKAGWGGAARFSANFRLLKGDKPVYWHTQLGYKTNGYLQGQYLREGLIWRIGLSFNGI